MKDEEKLRKRLSLIFGIVEMTLIVLLGLILRINIDVIAITILIFEVIRKFVKNQCIIKIIKSVQFGV